MTSQAEPSANYEEQVRHELSDLLIEHSADALDVAYLLKIHEMERCKVAAEVGYRKSYPPRIAALSYSYIQTIKAINSIGTFAFLASSEKRRHAKLCIRLKESIARMLNAEFGTKAGPVVESFAGDIGNVVEQ